MTIPRRPALALWPEPVRTPAAVVSPSFKSDALDRELVERVAAGDSTAAVSRLYERYGSRLYGLGVKLLRDPGMAEELVQETFVRLWRSAPNYDPARGSVRTFLFTIARRVAVDLMRRSASRPLPVTGSEETLQTEVADEEYDALLVALETRDALGAISPKHREVLELSFHSDLTQSEIARRLGLPLGTVKTRVFHGLKALKAELQRRDVT